MDSNLYDYRVCPEVTPGTTPTDSANWVPFPVSGAETLNARPQHAKSQDVDGSRLPRASRPVSLDVGGGLPFELKGGVFDTYIEALLGGTWASNVLSIGTTERAFSIEREASGLSSGNRFMLFTGMSVASMRLNVAYGQIITGEFAFQGMNGVYASSSAVGAGSEASASTKKSMVAAASVSAFQVNSSALSGVILNGMSLQVSSNLRARTGVDQSLGPAGQKPGTAAVTGELVLYLSENVLSVADYILNTTDTELDFTIGDGTDSYAFNLPVSQLMGDMPRGEGRDVDSFLRVGFDLEANLTITRTVT